MHIFRKSHSLYDGTRIILGTTCTQNSPLDRPFGLITVISFFWQQFSVTIARLKCRKKNKIYSYTSIIVFTGRNVETICTNTWSFLRFLHLNWNGWFPIRVSCVLELTSRQTLITNYIKSEPHAIYNIIFRLHQRPVSKGAPTLKAIQPREIFCTFPAILKLTKEKYHVHFKQFILLACCLLSIINSW